MKIGILTFHAANNYGAVLQAYGLKEVLRGMGHDAHVIDYRPEYLTSPYKLIPDSSKKSIFRFLRSLILSPVRLKKSIGFNRFRGKHLSLSSFDFASQCDALVTGSDQVWNPFFYGHEIDPVFLLSPAAPGCRKVSYAPSAGDVKKFEIGLNESTVDSLRGYRAISVRENDMRAPLGIHGISSQVVLDPVLLAGQAVFNRLCDHKDIPSKPYILTFSLTYDPTLYAKAKSLGREHGWEVISMSCMDEFIFHKDLLNSASPSHFVKLFKNAECVLTSSFHGTAFSILYEKPFISVGYEGHHSDRAKSLLESLGLTSRLCPVSILSDKSLDFSPYPEALDILSSQRETSLKFLADALA